MSKDNKNKLTSTEKKWILYDVANSAFVLLATTLIPIFFNMVAGHAGLPSDKYLAYWGYTQSVATIISAIAGPVYGAFSDRKGMKKRLFLITVAMGSIASLFLGLALQWLIFLVVFVIARVAFNLSLVIYDSMLNDITTEDRIDDISSQGYAWEHVLFTTGENITKAMTDLELATVTESGTEYYECIAVMKVRNTGRAYLHRGKPITVDRHDIICLSCVPYEDGWEVCAYFDYRFTE